MKKIFLSVMILGGLTTTAQDSTQTQNANPLTLSGYVEAYYVKDFNNPVNHTRPAFIYSHNRSGEVTLNLSYLKAAYKTHTVRANLALAAGTYMNANLAAESGVLKNIYEANAGIKLSKNSNLWLDAGIFPSHIGFESAIGKDCWNLTRSILADNSPYYESGAKLSYTSADNQWYLSAMVLNGWQRIQRVNGNTTLAFGTQVTYKPNSNITLNSSTFIGNDKPDSVRQMRYFHNFYGIFQVSSSITATLGLDAGMEQKVKGSSKMNTWYSPVVILKFNTSAKTALVARAEYYSDKNGVIISSGTPNGFRTWGFSANFDYNITPNAIWRIEARTFSSKDRIFVKDNAQVVAHNTFFSTALAVSF